MDELAVFPPILQVRCLTHIGGKMGGHLFPNDISLFAVFDYLFDPMKTTRGVQSVNWYVTYPLSGYGDRFMLVQRPLTPKLSIEDLPFINSSGATVSHLELSTAITLQHVLYIAYSVFRGISFHELRVSVSSDRLTINYRPFRQTAAPT